MQPKVRRRYIQAQVDIFRILLEPTGGTRVSQPSVALEPSGGTQSFLPSYQHQSVIDKPGGRPVAFALSGIHRVWCYLEFFTIWRLVGGS